MSSATDRPRFALCLSNEGCDDLLTWKLYRVLLDESALRDNYLRIVDESGEDYLYPAQQFAMIDLSAEVEDAFLSHYSEAA